MVFSFVKTQGIAYGLATWTLRVALLLGLFSAGWLVYQRLPHAIVSNVETPNSKTTLQLILHPSPEMSGVALDIPVELYPVDIVAVRHEYFTERRAGKRFDDFLNERMNGRTSINIRLDEKGQSSVSISPGNWWVHAVLSGDGDLEWRLPISVSGAKQTIELDLRNAYTRTKNF